ncbi:MAG: translation factor Sua5, partial [Proteobacteria bacterium]|nr:translation factor Sua5 [Pseudomonadota bacterium]
LILDGGSCEVGIESTIVDTTCTPFQILRPGGISADALEAVLGVPVARIASGEARAPGMLEAHYAPAARVLLATSADDAHRLAREGRRVGFIGLEEAAVPAGSVALGSASTPEAYAHDLYRWLRDADAQGLDLVVAVPPPPAGIGVGVIDRLKRAAASTP